MAVRNKAKEGKKVQKKVLSNGLTILYKNVPSETVTVEFSVHTGSIMEKKDEAGLSHFLEHLLFEGTKKRPTSRAIANEIEKYGGEFNAATSHERTFYYVKIANKHFTIALDILYDMFTRSLFAPKIIEKERKVILDEVNMVNDMPRHYQWILFHDALFQKHPAGRPVYGEVPKLRKITRKQILAYFAKWYVPSQITLVVTGNVQGVLQAVEKKCNSWKDIAVDVPSIPLMEKTRSVVRREKKKLGQSYMILGYKTVVRSHPDSYVFDVIAGILGRGQSGWLFDEIRAKRGLCYTVGFEYDGAKTYGMVGVYCGTNKKNITQVEKLIMTQFKRLLKVTAQDLSESKTYIEGSLALDHENTAHLAEEIADWHYSDSLRGFEMYVSRIKKVRLADVKRVVKKYFTKDYTMIVLEQGK
jgi:predicted Zn-dependent peptidase